MTHLEIDTPSEIAYQDINNINCQKDNIEDNIEDNNFDNNFDNNINNNINNNVEDDFDDDFYAACEIAGKAYDEYLELDNENNKYGYGCLYLEEFTCDI